MKKIVIFGISDAAELAHYYFTNDSEYDVSAFCVDSSYMPEPPTFCGLGIFPIETIAETHPPENYSFFVALGYSNLNKNRMEKYLAIKNMGYTLVSYVSSKASVLNNNDIGDNCFILEDNTIQPFVKIGNNVTMWSGNHIGHHSTIEDHCFLASHIVVSGRVTIGQRCFIGVNATMRDHIKVGKECIIGAGTLLLSDAEDNGVYIGSETERSRVPSHRLKKI